MFSKRYSKSHFNNSDLRGSRFQNANLSFASFQTARNYSIDPKENITTKLKVTIPELIGLLDFFDLDIQ